MAKLCAVKKTIKKDGKEIITCDNSKAVLLPLLQDIQKKKGYISDRDMQEIADQLNIHPVEVYSVVTFYSFLYLQKKGKNIIRISTCVPCELAGYKKIVKAFEQELNIQVGQTTKDKKFSLDLSSCIGMCDQAPAIMINDQLVGKITPKKVKQIIKDLSSSK